MDARHSGMPRCSPAFARPGRPGLLLLLLGLAGWSACSARAPKISPAEEDKPEVVFIGIEVADRIERAKDPESAVRAYLRIVNRGEAPLEIVKSDLSISGSIEARQKEYSGFFEEPIPGGASRVVEIQMALRTAGTGPSISLVPTIRGQLFFRTPQGRFTLRIYEALNPE